MRSTFKVLFYVKKGSEKPNGNLPLMCRITVDQRRFKQFGAQMNAAHACGDVKNGPASARHRSAENQPCSR